MHRCNNLVIGIGRDKLLVNTVLMLTPVVINKGPSGHPASNSLLRTPHLALSSNNVSGTQPVIIPHGVHHTGHHGVIMESCYPT